MVTWPVKKTQKPWDYKTRAQEPTSGAIRMLQSSFAYILEHFKDEVYRGKIAVSISMAILTLFTDFNIFWLWIDQFAWNRWPNWSIFAALADGKWIFDQFDPKFFLLTVEAGVKKPTFFFKFGNFGHKIHLSPTWKMT